MHAGTLLLADRTPVGGRRTPLGSSVDLVPPAGLGIAPGHAVTWSHRPACRVQLPTAHLRLELGLAVILTGARGGPA